MADIRFEIVTPLGFSVRTTNAYWQKGFLITAYQTDAIKEGVVLWPK